MMNGYVKKDWELLKEELKDAFRHADSRVYMYTRSYLERLCRDHRVLAKQKRRIKSTTTTATESGQRQSIFNVELTPERDSQHLRTAGGRLACQQKERAQ